MADLGQKISELAAAYSLDGTELIASVQSGQTKRATAAQLATLAKSGLTKSDVGLGNVENVLQYSVSNPPPTPSAADVGAIPVSQKGAASGVAELDSGGKVPSSQLPSYVDDVLEYASVSAFPATGESGKIYVAIDTGRTYRWSGSTYVEISNPVIVDDTLSVEGAAAEAAAVGDALAGKANIDGAYENMTVGNAEQLVSTVMVNDQVPYLFRTSGGSTDIGNREYDTIVGGTIAWNQIVQSVVGNQATITSSGNTHIATASGAQPFFGITFYNGQTTRPFVVGHKYLMSLNIDDVSIDNFQRIYITAIRTTSYEIAATVEDAIGRVERIVEPTDTYIAVNARTTNASTTTSDTFTVSNVMIVDLTIMFGNTVADFIYNLEMSAPGAGVTWFKSLFPKSYYTYNAGELLSVSGLQSHDMTGFNAYDATSGTAELLGGNDYQITGVYTALSYSTGESIVPDSNGVFTPSENGTLTVTGGDDSTTCVHLTWSGYRNGEYESYVKHSYPLDNTVTLRGIPKLDANNKLYYDGDRYLADGTVDKRYGIVDLGTLNWVFSQSAYFGAGISGKAYGFNNFIQPKYTVVLGTTAANLPDKSMRGGSENASIFIKDESFNGDTAAFKAAMSGVYLVYELATPTTENADPYQIPQIVDDFGTEEYVVAVEGDVAIPVGHDTNYPANLRDKLQHLPDLADDGDGIYIIQQSGSNMALVPLTTPTELPAAPSTDGTYALKCTVADGMATFSWEVE